MGLPLLICQPSQSAAKRRGERNPLTPKPHSVPSKLGQDKARTTFKSTAQTMSLRPPKDMFLLVMTLPALWWVQVQATCGSCWWSGCTSATISPGSTLTLDGATLGGCPSGHYAYVDGITIASPDDDYTSYMTYVDSSLTRQYDYCFSDSPSCSFSNSSTCGYGTGYGRDAVVVIKCENSDYTDSCQVVYNVDWYCAPKASNSDEACGSCTSSNCQNATIAPGESLTLDGFYHCPWGYFATVEGVTIASSDYAAISYTTYASSSLDNYYSNCSSEYNDCSASDFARCGLSAPSTSDAVVVINCKNSNSWDWCDITYGIDWFCDPTSTSLWWCGQCTSSGCQKATIAQRDTLFISGSGQCPPGYYAYVQGITIASPDSDQTSYKTYVDSSHTGYYSECSSESDSCSAYSYSTCGDGNDYESDAVVAITCQKDLYYSPNDTCKVDYDVEWGCAYISSTPTSTPHATTHSPRSTTRAPATTAAPSTTTSFEGSYIRTTDSCAASTQCDYKCAASYEILVTGSVAKAYSSANPDGCRCDILTADINGNKATGSTTDSTFVMTLTTTGLTLETTVGADSCIGIYNAEVAATTGGSSSGSTKGATFEWAVGVAAVALTSWAISRMG